MVLLGSVSREELITLLEKELEKGTHGTSDIMASAWQIAAKRLASCLYIIAGTLGNHDVIY